MNPDDEEMAASDADDASEAEWEINLERSDELAAADQWFDLFCQHVNAGNRAEVEKLVAAGVPSHLYEYQRDIIDTTIREGFKNVVIKQQLQFDILFDALPDISLRDQRDALERPFVSLSKNKRTDKAEYWFGDLFMRIIPNSEFGQPTIWDYDVIIYLLGQVNERVRRQRDYVAPGDVPTKVLQTSSGALRVQDWGWQSPAITVNPRQLLTAISRGTGGRDFKDLRAAIARLQTCVIETNIWHGKKLKRFKRFSLINEFEEVEPGESTSGGMTFTLPDWMINSVASRKGIFLIDKRYFQLTGGYDRFLYRMARKIVGRQEDTKTIKMATLHERSGSPMVFADFAKTMRKRIEKNEIPEYDYFIGRNADGEEVVSIRWRRGYAPEGRNDTPHEIGENDIANEEKQE